MDLKNARDPFSSNMANKRTNVPSPDVGSSKGHLLILDDVLSMKQLPQINLALDEARINISRVIIITKDPDIAKDYNKGHKVLEPLQSERAFELFQNKVRL